MSDVKEQEATLEPWIEGRIVSVMFHNEENLYSVVRVAVMESNIQLSEKEVVVVGTFPATFAEDTYLFVGRLGTHPRYGEQFLAERAERKPPSTEESLVLYFASSLFPGVGKRMARSIVDRLGLGAISSILTDPTLLHGLKGMTPEKALHIQKTLFEQQGFEEVLNFCGRHGIGTAIAHKIFQTYRDQSVKMLTDNPYQLVRDVDGIGFQRADEIATKINADAYTNERAEACLFHAVESACMNEGHTYLTFDVLYRTAYPFLRQRPGDWSEQAVKDICARMQTDGWLINEGERWYIPSLFYAEKGAALELLNRLERPFEHEYVAADLLLKIGEIEEEFDVVYEERQREAIMLSMQSRFMILTGGPGTGKTTVIQAIVTLFERLQLEQGVKFNAGKDIVLCAPTGRAAKRMSESTGLSASTIHRLLGWSGEAFQHDHNNPIGGRLIIVDEFSMVDTWLAYQLLRALPKDMQIIFVGDDDQLPSVGPGQVLRDLLSAPKIPKIELTQIYRQKADSSIIQLAHSLKEGQLPTDLQTVKSDRLFVRCPESQVTDVVVDLYDRAIKKGHTIRDIQVLAPMYKGKSGITALNVALQTLCNPKKERELLYGDVIYRTKDKVIQLVNRAEDDVYNGDVGEITSLFYAKENTDNVDQLVISFDGKEIVYKRNEFHQIMHAYCCSVHKSQGSEYRIVILPIVRGYYKMLRRNLIYTAITRSKQSLVIVGDEEALRQGIARNVEDRQTYLKEWLRFYDETPPENWQNETLQISMEFEESFSPFDFS
ncbi:MAG: SF1B family DNA helicase RecD2 [Bacilli bacterium]